MSGHVRFCFAALVLLAGLSASPASSNPLTDLFSPTPKQEPEPAPVEETCLSQPGKSTAAGQHWVYRLEGRRKCWFQAAEDVAVKKQVRHRTTKPRVATREEDEAVPRKRKAIDARAELLRPPPAETSQPMRPAPDIKVADASSPIGSCRISAHPARLTWRSFWQPHRPPETQSALPCLRPRRPSFPSPRHPMTDKAGWQPGLACCCWRSGSSPS
jgi:hypothetical protein